MALADRRLVALALDRCSRARSRRCCPCPRRCPRRCPQALALDRCSRARSRRCCPCPRRSPRRCPQPSLCRLRPSLCLRPRAWPLRLRERPEKIQRPTAEVENPNLRGFLRAKKSPALLPCFGEVRAAAVRVRLPVLIYPGNKVESYRPTSCPHPMSKIKRAIRLQRCAGDSFSPSPPKRWGSPRAQTTAAWR